MKRVLFVFSALLLLATAVMVIACSSDEDDEKNSSEIELDFSLLNEKGKETTIFKEGENVCFDLKIVNNGNSEFIYCLDFDGGDLALDNDFFCVYTDKGERFGTPWTGMFYEMSLQKEWHIPAKTTYHIMSSWLYSSVFPITHPLCKVEEPPHLSQGVYEVAFNVKYRTSPNAKNLTIKKFNIKFTVE